MSRLRQKAISCEFPSVDEAIRDQIIEKCRPKTSSKERKCYRCGGTGYLAQDKGCPTLDKTCNKCGKSGHFAACCKKKSTKKLGGRHRSEGAIKVSKEKEEEDNYAFVLDTKSGNGSSGVVDLSVGGVQLKNALIYSGATCNIVDRATWESLKQKGVKCKSRKCEKKLFAYGQTKPIEIVGTFESEINCGESGESVWMSLLMSKVVVKLC